MLNTAVNNPLFEFHIRNAVHKEASDTVRSLIYSNTVSAHIKKVRCCKSGRSRTYDGNFFACTDCRNFRFNITVFKSIFYNCFLVLFRAYGVAVKSACTGLLAKCRADS